VASLIARLDDADRRLGLAEECGHLLGVTVRVVRLGDGRLRFDAPSDRLLHVQAAVAMVQQLAGHSFRSESSAFADGVESQWLVSLSVPDINPAELAFHLAACAGMPIAVDPTLLEPEAGSEARRRALREASSMAVCRPMQRPNVRFEAEPWGRALGRILDEAGLAITHFWEVWLLTTRERALELEVLDRLQLTAAIWPPGGDGDLGALASVLRAAGPGVTAEQWPDDHAVFVHAEAADIDAVRAVVAERDLAFEAIPTGPDSDFTGSRMTLAFDAARLQDFADLVANLAGLELDVGVGLRGAVVADASDVRWDNAFAAILRLNRLAYEVTGPSQLRVFPEAPPLARGSIRTSLRSHYAAWFQLFAPAFLSQGGALESLGEGQEVVVRGVRAEVASFARFISAVEEITHPGPGKDGRGPASHPDGGEGQ
jgi:hypothetical protein